MATMKIPMLSVTLTTLLLTALPVAGAPANSADDTIIDVGGLRAPASMSGRVVGSAAGRKRYAGGVDEDDVQVQQVLPTASRGIESAEVDTQAPAPTTPTTAETHGD